MITCLAAPPAGGRQAQARSDGTAADRALGCSAPLCGESDQLIGGEGGAEGSCKGGRVGKATASSDL